MQLDSRSRKWQITINNPVDKGYTHDKIVEILKLFVGVSYYCFSDEIGENKTFHTHIFIYSRSAIRFSTLFERFEGGHFEMAKGTCEQNRNYVFKTGKWADTEKNSTNIEDSHIEWGMLPIERQGARNDLADLYDMIRAGMSDYEIITNEPSYMAKLDVISQARGIILGHEFKNCYRNIEVIYIYGSPGVGKTRYVVDKYGYDKLYRVTDYAHPFDSYAGQDILVLDEFRSSLRIGLFLEMTDGHPCELPCRYYNRQACFTKVYILTNIPLRQQYTDIQQNSPSTWKAFLRRIKSNYHMTPTGLLELDKNDQYVTYDNLELPWT